MAALGMVYQTRLREYEGQTTKRERKRVLCYSLLKKILKGEGVYPSPLEAGAHSLRPGTAAKMTVSTATMMVMSVVTQMARPINNLRT
jgi:hypothetical protein